MLHRSVVQNCSFEAQRSSVIHSKRIAGLVACCVSSLTQQLLARYWCSEREVSQIERKMGRRKRDVMVFVCIIATSVVRAIMVGDSASAIERRAETVSGLTRMKYRVGRLREYHGKTTGRATVTHALIVAVGLLGMVSAIVGAILGAALPESDVDSDSVTYWLEYSVDDNHNDDNDEYANGCTREEMYGVLRATL